MDDTTWHDAGQRAGLPPGTMRQVSAFGTRILVANVEGQYFAVGDTCTHEDASLSLGALDGETIRCPLHGSRFCLRDGQALDEPAEIDLETYSVDIRNDRIQIAQRR